MEPGRTEKDNRKTKYTLTLEGRKEGRNKTLKYQEFRNGGKVGKDNRKVRM